MAALRQAGAVVVDATEELAGVAVVPSRARLPPRRAPGIGVLVGQAGAGLVILDRLRFAGVSVPTLNADTMARWPAAAADDLYKESGIWSASAAFAEALRDTAAWLAPVSLAEAHEMLRELHAAPHRCSAAGAAAPRWTGTRWPTPSCGWRRSRRASRT